MILITLIILQLVVLDIILIPENILCNCIEFNMSYIPIKEKYYVNNYLTF